MKKTIIGCCLTAIGALSNVFLFISASFQVNQLDSWYSTSDKIITAIENTGILLLVFPVTISIILLLTGLLILFKEFARK